MEHLDEIHANRIKHNICAVSIEKLTNNGKDVKTFASAYFGNKDERLGDIIDASPVIFDSGIFQRKTWALYEHLISPMDFTDNNEIMLIRISFLEQLFKKQPSLKSAWYNYFRCFVLKTSETITQDDIEEAIVEVQKVCSVVTDSPLAEYDIIMTPSIKDECLLGFIPRKGLYDVVVAHNPSYITNKSPQKCRIVDGELRIKLW